MDKEVIYIIAFPIWLYIVIRLARSAWIRSGLDVMREFFKINKKEEKQDGKR